MTVVETGLIIEQQPAVRAADALRNVLEENKASITTGDASLQSATVSELTPSVAYPAAFIDVLDVTPIPQGDARYGQEGAYVRLSVTATIQAVGSVRTAMGAYRVGDALAAVLRSQGKQMDGDYPVWEFLHIDRVTYGQLTRQGASGNLRSVRVEITAPVYMEATV